jgi:hypothetical protein
VHVISRGLASCHEPWQTESGHLFLDRYDYEAFITGLEEASDTWNIVFSVKLALLAYNMMMYRKNY